MTMTKHKSDDVLVLEHALASLTSAFDAFLQECTNEQGGITAPTKQAYMQARACLPAGYSMTLTRRKPKDPK